MKNKSKIIRLIGMTALFLLHICQLHAGTMLENMAFSKNYDFNRLPERVEANTVKLLTDGIKAQKSGNGYLCWSGSEEVIITVDLTKLCKVYNATVDFFGAREIKAYISRDNILYEKLPVNRVGDEAIIGGAGAVEGQFLKIAVLPEGSLKCSELEVTGHAIGEGVKSDVGLSLWQAANQNIAGDSGGPLSEKVSWDISKSYKEETPTRKRICLNGIWKFQPVQDEGKFFPLSSWGYSQFPFVLAGGDIEHSKGFIIYDKNMNRLSNWDGVEVKDFRNGWWKREFVVPADFRGRRICLKIDYIGYYGKVYLNGQLLGEGYLNRENRFDISAMVKWDRPNELMIFASGDPKSQKVFSRGSSYGVSGKTVLLVGDAWLESFPAQAYFKTIQIVTSTRKQELKLLLDIIGQGEFILSGEIYDKDTKVKDLPGKKVQVGGGRISYACSWNDTKYWSVETPHLYWLILYLKDGRGNVIDQTYRNQFGFREFWAEGGDYYLNGIKTRLFLDSNPPGGWISHASSEEWMTENFGALKKMGFNSVRYMVNTYEEKILKVADEVGMLVILDAAEIVMTGGFEMDASKGLDLWQHWNHSKEAQQQTGDDMKELIARLGNHPSLVMWLMTFNSLDHIWTMNPYKIDGSYIPYPNEGGSIGFLTKEKVDVALKLENILYEFDGSTRPIFHHSCGNVGQAITVNAYFNFGFPKQEWEDWPMLWSKQKPKPLICTEDSRPIYPAWLGIPLNGWGKGKPEPFHVEYAAMYLGDDSYQGDFFSGFGSPGANKFVMDRWNKRQTISDFDYWAMLNYFHNHLSQSADVGCLLDRDITRAWRTYGVSGIGLFAIEQITCKEWTGDIPSRYPDQTLPGPKPDLIQSWADFKKPNKLFYAIMDSLARVKIYIGGPGDNFTAKDHCYFSGEEMVKQVIILNDSEHDVSGKAEVKLLGPEGINQTILSETISVKAGEQGRKPLKFITPPVNKRQGYDLEVTLTTGENKYKDVFRLTVFPREKVSCGAKVLLLDDVGITEKVLREAGVGFDKPGKVKDINGYRILVIGRDYGKKGGVREAARIDLQGALARGISVVVFEQPKIAVFDTPLAIDHNDTSFVGLKLREGSYRYAFIRDGAHPILAGLEASDLIDWRGESDMMEAYPQPDSITETSYPERFWKLGNKGIVSTYAIEKPSKGSFRVIADAGFDLSDAVLLEWMEGKSRIIFCQADVSNRYGKDPVATKIIHNILKYCEDSPRQVRGAVYIGGDKGIKLLDTIGVIYRKSEIVGDIAGNNLLILGDMSESQIADCGEEIKDFVIGGGTALYLPTGAVQGCPPSLYPPGLSFQNKKIFSIITSKSMNMDLLRGLGMGDFFLKDYYNVAVPVSLPEGGVGTDPAVVSSMPYGKGKCIFLSLDPLIFEGKYPYERVIRTWNTILTNLGVDSRNMMLENAQSFLRGRLLIELAGKWAFKTDPSNKGMEEGWNQNEFNDKDWNLLQVPGYWEEQGKNDVNPYWKPPHENCVLCSPEYHYNGYAWYRKHIFIPESMREVSVSLKIGGIDDYDWTYFNGVLIGKMGEETPDAYCTWRRYNIPVSLIKYGQENVIAVRVYDLHGVGGFVGNPVKIMSTPSMASDTMFYVKKYLKINPYRYHRW